MVQSLACDLWRESAWQSWLLDISCCGHGYKLFDVIQPMTFGDVICQIYTSKYTTLLHMMTIYIYFHREGWPLPQTELVVWLLNDLVEWGTFFHIWFIAAGSSPATCEGQGWRESPREGGQIAVPETQKRLIYVLFNGCYIYLLFDLKYDYI